MLRINAPSLTDRRHSSSWQDGPPPATSRDPSRTGTPLMEGQAEEIQGASHYGGSPSNTPLQMATSPTQVEVASLRQATGLHEISATTTPRQNGHKLADVIVSPLLLDTLYVSGSATFADYWEDIVSDISSTCLEVYLYPEGDHGPTVVRAADARSRRRLEDTDWMAAVRPGGLVGDGPTVCHLEIRDPSGGLIRISVGPARRGSHPVVVRPEARVLYAHAFKQAARQAPYDVLNAACATMQGMGIYVDWSSAKVARVDVDRPRR